VKLPVLNGLETYLTIKEINPRVSAIMMTGYRQEVGELVEEALRSSAYTCLFKPLDMDKVVALVAEINRQRRKGALRKPQP
jgi:two-component system response regulator HydG